MLRTSLESHPAIVCNSELFNSDNRNLPYPLSTSTREILDQWVYHEYPPETRCVGFVLQSYHPWGLSLVPEIRQNPNWADVWTLIAEMQDLKVLHLKRTNLLRRHVSHVLARTTSVWHAWDHDRVSRVSHLGETPAADKRTRQQAGRPQVTLDAARLEADFLDVERARRFAEEQLAGREIMEVNYEEFCSSYEVVCAAVLRFLEVSTLPLRPAVAKLEHRPLAETVSNYRELKDHFAGTRWETFFEE